MNFASVQVQNIQCIQTELHWLLEEMAERLESLSDPETAEEKSVEIRKRIQQVYQNATGTWLNFMAHHNPKLYHQLKQEIQEWSAQGFPSTIAKPLSLEDNPSPYALEVNKLGLSIQERLVLLLAIFPHIQPDLFDMCLEDVFFRNPLVGGKKTNDYQGFLPTGQTALFLLGGDDLLARNMYRHIFDPQHIFAQKGILSLAPVPEGQPKISGTLVISDEYLHRLLIGTPYEPQFSPDFPARKLTTDMTWNDIVLPWSARSGIDDLLLWIRHYHDLMENPEFGKERKGYKCLLYGEPGTGKTLTVRLLSHETDNPIYRVSIDKLVSKYVGETTKNIAKVFQQARNRDWILFFDEGDALFSKRSGSNQSAQDTFVNQDVAFLLQEIEDYPGIVIVATNNLNSMDKAFFRRFDTIIHFQEPDEQLRYEMWQNALKPFDLDPAINLQDIAKRYKKNGAFIKRVKHYLGIQALAQGTMEVKNQDLEQAIAYN